MRLERSSTDDGNQYIKVWIGKTTTGIEDWARRLDLEDAEYESFLRDIWDLLTDDLRVLTRLDSLKWASRDPIKGTQNVYHVDAQKIRITEQDERYRCSFCGRIHPRATPNRACTRWRCAEGEVELMEDTEPRDYDLVELEDADTFVMAEEHTAQVPNKQRERIEREFKEGRDVNCLVATPTLELGVDIGALDMVLLRKSLHAPLTTGSVLAAPGDAIGWRLSTRTPARIHTTSISSNSQKPSSAVPFGRQISICRTR